MLRPLEQQVFVRCHYHGASCVTRFSVLMVIKDDLLACWQVRWGLGAGSCVDSKAVRVERCVKM